MLWQEGGLEWRMALYGILLYHIAHKHPARKYFYFYRAIPVPVEQAPLFTQGVLPVEPYVPYYASVVYSS